MGLTTLPAYCYYPYTQWWHGALWQQGLQTSSIANSGEKVAFIVKIPKSGTLHKVGFLTGTVSNSQTLKVSFQNIDPATGNADGTPDQYRTVASPATNTWTTTGILSDDGTDTGNKRSVSIGEYIAVVIEFDSTIGNVLISSTYTGAGSRQRDGYVSRYASSAWTKYTNYVANCLLEYSDGSYGHAPWLSVITHTNPNYYNHVNSTPDEFGMRFQVPVPMTMAGIYVNARFDGDADIVLYDSPSNVLATVPGYDGTTSVDTVDKDIAYDILSYWGQWMFSTPVNLEPNTTYRVSLKPTTTTAVYYFAIAVPTNAALAQFSSTAFYKTYRTDGGSWTDVDTQAPNWALIISAINGAEPTSGFGGGLNY